MDQTRFTLLGIVAAAVLAIVSGFLSQWYAAGARPSGDGSAPMQTVLAQTIAAVTLTAEALPTPEANSVSKLIPEESATDAFYADLLLRARGWDLVVFDGFDDNTSGWGTGDSTTRATGQRIVEEGHYVWELDAYESLTWASGSLGAPFEEFMASVDVDRDSAENGSIGIVFRLNDYDNYYQFNLCPGSQSFDLWRQLNGDWETLNACETTNAINPLGTNTLTVIALENSYFLYINDTFVNAFDSSTLTNGLVGVSVDLDQDQANRFIFDNFELRSPLNQ